MESKFFLFIFSFLFLFCFVSASLPYGVDFEINSTSNICLHPGYDYGLNISDFYDWSDGALGYAESSSDSSHMLRCTQYISEYGGYSTDEVYLDGYYYYYFIPLNSSYWTTYTFGDYLVFEPGSANLGYPSFCHLLRCDSSNCASETGVWSIPQSMTQSNSCSLSLYPNGTETGGGESYNYTIIQDTFAFPTSSIADTGFSGGRIIANNNVSVLNITKDASTTATKAYVYWFNGTMMTSSTFSGNLATFSNPPVLVAGQTYMFVIDNAGASYTKRYEVSNSYPQPHTSFNITQGCNGCTNTTFSSTTDVLSGITGVGTSTNISLGSSNESNETLIKYSDISNQSMDFYDYLEIPLQYYFDYYNTELVVYNDSVTSTLIVFETGYGYSYEPYFRSYLGASGYDQNLSFFSLGIPSNTNISVFACDNSTDIDSWCPYPAVYTSCNVSRLYTDSACVSTNFFLNVSGSNISEVEQIRPFTYYHPLDDDECYSFSIPYYFSNYDLINFTWTDDTAHSLNCSFGVSSNQTIDSSLYVNLDCSSWPEYVTICPGSFDGNSTFYFNLSNSISYETDYFMILAGNWSWSDMYDPSYSNLWGLKGSGLFPESDEFDNPLAMKLLAFVIVLVVLTISILFICIPLRFNVFAIIITAVLFLCSLVLVAGLGYLSWNWVIVPVVLIVLFVLIKWLLGVGK